MNSEQRIHHRRRALLARNCALSVCLSVAMSVCMSVYMFVCLTLHLSGPFCLSACVYFVCPSACVYFSLLSYDLGLLLRKNGMVTQEWPDSFSLYSQIIHSPFYLPHFALEGLSTTVGLQIKTQCQFACFSVFYCLFWIYQAI